MEFSNDLIYFFKKSCMLIVIFYFLQMKDVERQINILFLVRDKNFNIGFGYKEDILNILKREKVMK